MRRYRKNRQGAGAGNMSLPSEDPNSCNFDGPLENISTRKEYFNSSSINASITIFVGNLPAGLDEGGLCHLMIMCGARPVNIRIVTDEGGKRIAFVDLTTIQAATRAIQDLNNKPPLFLRVATATKKPNVGRPGSKNAEPVPVFGPAVSRPTSEFQCHVTRTVGRGAGARKSTAVHRAYRSHMQNRIVNDSNKWSHGPADINGADRLLHVPKNLFDEVNLKLVARSDGRRTISMGRGYYIPRKRPGTQAGVAQFDNHESNGVYSYGIDVLAPSAPCTLCEAATVKKCTECGAYYCSDECQSRDWENHKQHCKFTLCIDLRPGGVTGETRLISLKPLSEPIRPQALPCLGTPQSFSLRRKVIDILRVAKEGIFEVSKSSPESKLVYGTICCKEAGESMTTLVLNLPEAVQNAPLALDFRPGKGSIVAVSVQESWWRGMVLTVPSETSDEYRVGLIELAKLVTVSKIDMRPLSPEFADLPDYGVKCIVTNSHVQGEDLWSKFLRVRSDLRVSVERTEGSALICKLKSDEGDNICEVVMERWNPEEHLKENQVVQVPSGSRVILTAYHSQHVLFVRPTGKSHVELRNTVLQQVAASHVIGLPMDRHPRRDEMVACLCVEDGNYYRALVREVSPEDPNKYKVWFVDFGNIADVGIEHMKLLSEDIKNHPILAVKVSLKDVSEHKLTMAAAEYLSDLLDKEEVMTVQYGGSLEDGVDLYARDGTHINQRLNSLLEPSWKKHLANDRSVYDDKIFMLEDLVPLPLIEGDQDEAHQLPVIVLYLSPEDGTILCCPAHSSVVPEVTTSLNAQINEFCESRVSNISYNPRKHEICLARYSDGSWQRALSVESIEGGSRVVFLDFGGTENVEFRNMRRMLQSFMEMPMLVSVCQIKGLSGKTSEACTKKLRELIKLNTVINLHKVKALDQSPGEYEVELPEVISALRAEGLF